MRLFIQNSKKPLPNIDKTRTVYKKIYEIYGAKYFSYIFFEQITLSHTLEKISTYDIKMISNCLLINGTITIPENIMSPSISQFLNEYLTEITPKQLKSSKLNNYIYRKHNNTIQEYNTKQTLPNTLIIGIQKSNTTSVLLNLRKHSEISAPSDEIHYHDILLHKGQQWYSSNFNKNKIILEKNPNLIYLTNTHQIIQSINPFTKHIIILRNPIERAYSSYNMVNTNGWTHHSFKESIDNELSVVEPKTFHSSVYHFLKMGLYYEQLIELYKYFPKQNCLILFTEDFKENSQAEYNKIFTFLNISPKILPNVNERVGIYRESISEDIKKELITYFKPDILKLEILLNKNLSHWY